MDCYALDADGSESKMRKVSWHSIKASASTARRDAVHHLRYWPPLERNHVLVAIGAVSLVTLLMIPIRGSLGVLNPALIYLVVVFAIALRAGSRAAAIAALLSFALLDVFFFPPFHTFTVASRDHVLALFVYLIVAIVTGQLVSRLRSRTAIAERAERRATLLAELNSALITGVTLDAILAAIVQRVVQITSAATAQILTPDPESGLTMRASAPTPSPLDRQDLAVATWVLENRQPSGRRALADTSFGRWRKRGDTRRRALLMLPIATTERPIGVLAIEQAEGSRAFSPDDEMVLATFATQAALAIDRARLTEEAARSAALAQSDELKSALLAAVSHDLRTPLATIKASTTSLMDESVSWDAAARHDFLAGIDEETDRLTLMVSNLLDLSRIEGGALKPDRDWVDSADLINDVVRRLRTRALAATHALETDFPGEPPILWLDYIEIAEVLLNLGDNAMKYTPDGSIVRFGLRVNGRDAIFNVTDNGPGMSRRDRNRVFEKFVRGESSNAASGSGIGLTISKGLVEAHGGRIWIESLPGEGTTVFFSIPRTEQQSHER
jgi:two-component system sensor histidine kinase KdpD